MNKKVCTGFCKNLLEINENNFYKRTDSKDGFRDDCKDCVKSKIQKRNFEKGKIKYTLNNNFIHTCALKEEYILCKGKCQRILRYNKDNFHIYKTKLNNIYLKTTCIECTLEEKKEHYIINQDSEIKRSQEYKIKRREELGIEPLVSKGEYKIKQWLESRKLNFNTEKHLFNLLSPQGFRLSFDFYLPEKNLAIEYDGELHYKAIEYFGGEKQLKRQQELDQIKNNYCQENNINLLRIPYWERNNIENILLKTLS